MRYPASEKAEIIQLVEQSHLPAKRTLDKLGIPRATFYRWYDRYREGGVEALADHRSRPNRAWNRIPDNVRGQIIDLALELPELSPRELAVRFTDARKYFVSEASVYRLLTAAAVSSAACEGVRATSSAPIGSFFEGVRAGETAAENSDQLTTSITVAPPAAGHADASAVIQLPHPADVLTSSARGISNSADGTTDVVVGAVDDHLKACVSASPGHVKDVASRELPSGPALEPAPHDANRSRGAASAEKTTTRIRILTQSMLSPSTGPGSPAGLHRSSRREQRSFLVQTVTKQTVRKWAFPNSGGRGRHRS